MFRLASGDLWSPGIAHSGLSRVCTVRFKDFCGWTVEPPAGQSRVDASRRVDKPHALHW